MLELMVKRASEWLLNVFLEPPVNRRVAMVIVWAGVLVVGVGDYALGIAPSLSLLYLLPITAGTAWLGGRWGFVLVVAVTLIRLGGDWLSHQPEPLPLHAVWNALAALPILLLVARLLQSLLVLQRSLQDKVEAQSRELLDSAADRARLELEILDVSARERSAFGRELHDELGQHLFATALAAETLAAKLPDKQRADEAKAIVHWIEEAISKTRNLARGLLLSRIPPDRFAQELEELVISANRTSVRGRMVQSGARVTADEKQCAQLYRIAQEAVTNALRHARARAINIDLACDAEGLRMTISDDGCGLPTERTRPGMGLRIMDHRARIIGATLAIRSSPVNGTHVICRLPLQKTSP